MRKLLTWLLVTLGVAALVRRLRRRRGEPALPPAAPQTTDPAQELRRKLEESRSDTALSEASLEVPVSERRAEVHDEGRAALDEMRARDQEP